MMLKQGDWEGAGLAIRSCIYVCHYVYSMYLCNGFQEGRITTLLTETRQKM